MPRFLFAVWRVVQQRGLGAILLAFQSGCLIADTSAPPFRIPDRTEIDSFEVVPFVGGNAKRQINWTKRHIVDSEKIDRLVSFMGEHSNDWKTSFGTPAQYTYSIALMHDGKPVTQFWADKGGLGAHQSGVKSGNLQYHLLNSEDWALLKDILNIDAQ